MFLLRVSSLVGGGFTDFLGSHFCIPAACHLADTPSTAHPPRQQVARGGSGALEMAKHRQNKGTKKHVKNRPKKVRRPPRPGPSLSSRWLLISLRRPWSWAFFEHNNCEATPREWPLRWNSEGARVVYPEEFVIVTGIPLALILRETHVLDTEHRRMPGAEGVF